MQNNKNLTLEPYQGFFYTPFFYKVKLVCTLVEVTGRIAQRESTSLTSKGSLVQSQLRPPYIK